MKKAYLYLFFSVAYLTANAQQSICVDASYTGTETGSSTQPYRTIQAAIAIAASTGDSILVAQGIYSENISISDKRVSLIGGFAGNGSFTISDPISNETIIQGQNASPCIAVTIETQAISGQILIKGFTIRGGLNGIAMFGEFSGFLSNITIEDNLIENNGTTSTDGRGGGIAFEGSNITIRNNTIRNNVSGRGAAISRTNGNPENFLIDNNIIQNNIGHDDHAGGLFINGTGIISNNLFEDNRAAEAFNYGWGGAVMLFNYDTTKLITLSHNVYRNNYAPSRGGAVFVDEAAKVLFDHELLYNNSTNEGGSAIYVDADFGNNPSVAYIKNCTIADNSTVTPGGVAVFVQASRCFIENSIFWNNGGDFELSPDGQAAALLNVDYTLSQQGFTGTGNITADPLFASSSDYHLKSIFGRYDPVSQSFVTDSQSSPAIDAGNPNSDYNLEPQDNGGRINLGVHGNTIEASKSGFIGLQTLDQNKNSFLLPNPAETTFSIYTEEPFISAEIFDLTGKSICVVHTKNTISVDQLPSGIYIVKLFLQSGNYTQKLKIN